MLSEITLDQRRATASPTTFNATALTVEATVATSAPVKRRDAAGPFDEVLDPNGADLNALVGASVLNSHRQDGLDNVLGTILDARVEGGEIVARIQFSSRPEVAPIIEDVRSGVIKFLSVGYSVETWADSKNAQGERTRTATKWTPREVSFVPVPADRTSQTRKAPTMDTTTDRPALNRAIRDLAKRAGATTTLTDDLIDRSVNIDEARQAILDEMLARGRVSIQTAHHNANSLDNPEALVRAAGEALYTRVDPNHKPDDAARQFVGLSMAELAREVLRRNGVSTTSMGADTVITRALTTSDFPQILADTVGRTLRVSYQAAPSGVRQLARETTAVDFRKKSRLMLDSSGLTLKKVTESGEFQSGAMTEAGESYRLDTFGRIIGLSRQAIVNDDLAAFTDLSRRFGQAAASFEAQQLVDLIEANSGNGPTMSDTKTLFHADHGNVAFDNTPLSTTSYEALSAARLAMRKQTGPDGGLISVTPKFLLVPAEQETVAQQMLADISAVDVEKVNPFSWLVLVVEPRLQDPARWYVVASPDEIDGLEFAYLAGAPGPQVESRAGFTVDGVEIKIRLDHGCGFVEHRSWFTNAGGS